MTELLKNILQGHKDLRGLNAVLLWDDVVESKIKKHTRALKLNRGTLSVVTENSVWAQELNFFKKEIMDRINIKAGSKVVRNIMFKVGGIKE
ncbi:DUF721 domain-containing protein [Candidatus Saganbacteria bacterium]|nr:DUF721 domain-containing protein [Candidatus Saganbacteria bacterium]